MQSIDDYKRGDAVNFHNKSFRVQDDKGWKHIVVTSGKQRKKYDLKLVLQLNDLETVEGWQRLEDKNILTSKLSNMSTLSEHHKKLNEFGEGKCSVPMWSGGMPAGFCDQTAYSEHRGGKYWDNPRTGERIFENGAYSGYVPALACPAHGGKTKEEAVNLCDNCVFCIADCGGNPKFGTGEGNDNVYECDMFTTLTKPVNN